MRCMILLLVASTLIASAAIGEDLPEIKERGVLRHLGIPYANFVTGTSDGMDVELIKNFANHLGVRYEYVRTDWGTVVEDLVGKKVRVTAGEPEIIGDAPIKGDLIANGFTILPWRKKMVDFSDPVFPSQIWLVARADSRIKPIKPSATIETDIQRVRSLLKGKKVLALKNTCLDPDLYKLTDTGAKVVCFNGKLNELAPAIINGDAEMTMLDVPDALVALEKWPGDIKVIGPLSPLQQMGVAFPKSSPKLAAAFNDFLRQSKEDGSYYQIVKKYYPAVFIFFPDFFKDKR